MKFKLDPIKELALFLGTMSLIATGFAWNQAGTQLLLHWAATLGFALLLYWFYTLISSKKKNVWNTVITALIIFLVLDYGREWTAIIYPLITVFIAISIKFFIEYKRSPIINPAVAGLLLMAGIVTLIPQFEPAFISWWGASFQGWVSMALMLFWIFWGLRKWRKFPTLISFLITHVVVMILRDQSGGFIQYTLTDSSIYFWLAIMLIEPKTSPSLKKQQTYFGMLAAILYNIFAQYHAPFFELFAIAGANLAKLGLRPTRKRMSKRATSAEE